MQPEYLYRIPISRGERVRKVYALGFFDGVHLGHRALLEEAARLARELSAKRAAITFDRHPQAHLGIPVPKLLTDCADRVRLLQLYGVEYVRLLPTNAAIMGLDWETFLEQLEEDGAVGFVCGSDFRFGKGGQGNAGLLEEFCRQRGLACRVIPEQQLDGVRISSSHIRQLLEAGQAEQAAEFLGHPHLLTGKVTRGRQLGHTLGFPTANIPIAPFVLCPRHGVYATRAYVDGRSFPAVTNVGSRPTVQGTQVRTETWIQGLQEDLYGKRIWLEFYCFLRPEQRFDSLEQLKAAVEEDARKALEYFKKNPEKPENSPLQLGKKML